VIEVHGDRIKLEEAQVKMSKGSDVARMLE
jgi:hypothetical protein